jgi:hypothetical protein
MHHVLSRGSTADLCKSFEQFVQQICYKSEFAFLQSKEEMNTMITTRIEEMWETLDRNQS